MVSVAFKEQWRSGLEHSKASITLDKKNTGFSLQCERSTVNSSKVKWLFSGQGCLLAPASIGSNGNTTFGWRHKFLPPLSVHLRGLEGFSLLNFLVRKHCGCTINNILVAEGRLLPTLLQLLVALVISCLDYCNSLLAGLPASSIRPPQLIQNAAARLVFNLNSRKLYLLDSYCSGFIPWWLNALIVSCFE